MSELTRNNDAYSRAVKLVAETTALLSNGNADSIPDFLLTQAEKQAKKSEDAKNFFLFRAFKIDLPPASKKDWNRRIAIEAEVLRAL